MKILLINGSPNAQGNTFNLLSFIDEELKKNGLETQWINIGKKAVHGCIDCGHCKTAKRCVFEDDLCNNIIEAILQADGVIVGSPVYFTGSRGAGRARRNQGRRRIGSVQGGEGPDHRATSSVRSQKPGRDRARVSLSHTYTGQTHPLSR